MVHEKAMFAVRNAEVRVRSSLRSRPVEQNCNFNRIDFELPARLNFLFALPAM